jgi:hypothetical protein
MGYTGVRHLTEYEMMAKNHTGESATIIQFPAGGRSGLLAKRELTAPVQRPVVDTGSWYHDEAVREAELAKKH